jgi:hypothetical protein
VSSVNSLSRLFDGGPRGRELAHAFVSVVVFLAGIGAVWFVQRVLELEGEAILVALLVFPFLLYLILSDKVREFGAGSFSVKLREVSRAPVKERYVSPESVLEFDALEIETEKTDPNRPRIVTLRLGRAYDRKDILTALERHSARGAIPLLVILDDWGRVLAYMTFRSADDLLERPERGKQFTDLVQQGDARTFHDGGGFSAVRTETLRETDTNAYALETMERTGLDALVVVGRRGQFAGIVERGRLLSTMMLALVSPSSNA